MADSDPLSRGKRERARPLDGGGLTPFPPPSPPFPRRWHSTIDPLYATSSPLHGCGQPPPPLPSPFHDGGVVDPWWWDNGCRDARPSATNGLPPPPGGGCLRNGHASPPLLARFRAPTIPAGGQTWWTPSSKRRDTRLRRRSRRSFPLACHSWQDGAEGETFPAGEGTDRFSSFPVASHRHLGDPVRRS